MVPRITWNLARLALSIGAAAALLAACGESQPLIGAPGSMPQTRALAARPNGADYKVVYSFGGGSSDGADPEPGLIDMGGTLYGTTSAGGSYSCDYYENSGCGTAFSITLGGTEKVLHNFANGADGATPYAPLIGLKGTLYGTTYFGGSYACYGSSYASCGTIFSITPSGAEKVLYSFGGSSGGGAYPLAGLIGVDGTLYGTTNRGGDFSSRHGYAAFGTVFSVTTSGTETVLHSFGSHHDGARPGLAGLINVGGKLYGTTTSGGRNGRGTVFSITLGGGEKVLHSFGKGTDGAHPAATLIELKGELYGTTSMGGARGVGTVFSITPAGTERVLHSFGKGTDGAHPHAPLTELKGKFYGTTLAGGSGPCSGDYNGCGTVFSITPDGREKVLYSFEDTPDGDWPQGDLLNVEGILYGTTMFGGTHNVGTVFSLKP